MSRLVAGILSVLITVSVSSAYTLNGVVVPDYTDVGYKRESGQALPQQVDHEKNQ